MPTVDTVIREIESNARMEFLPVIGREKGAFVEQLVVERRPCLAIEIGALVGYTTLLIARNLADGCKVVAFEIGSELSRRAQANIDLAGLSSKAQVILGDARQHLEHIEGPIDLLFIDAERTQYLNYLKKIEPKLSPGATIIAAGSGLHARMMKNYLDYVRESGRYETTSRVFGDDALEVSIFRG